MENRTDVTTAASNEVQPATETTAEPAPAAATTIDPATAGLLQQLMNELKGYKEKEAKSKEYNLNSQAKTLVYVRKAKEAGIVVTAADIEDERQRMATRTRNRI